MIRCTPVYAGPIWRRCRRNFDGALKTLLDQREIEKISIEQTLVANLKRFVLPYLDTIA